MRPRRPRDCVQPSERPLCEPHFRSITGTLNRDFPAPSGQPPGGPPTALHRGAVLCPSSALVGRGEGFPMGDGPWRSAPELQGSYFTSSKDGFPGISVDWPPSDRFHGDRRPSVPRDRRCGGSSTLVWSATERWDDGTGWLLIERSKTDQTGEGEVVFITRRAMTALDELRQIREDYGDASPSVFVMTAKTINCRVKAAAQAAGLGEGFSGHSAWWGWPGGWTGPAPGLGDHAAGPMAQHRRGGEVHPGRVRPVAEMRGMSQRSFGGVAVPTVRVCRAQHGRALQQPSGLGRHYSAPGGRRRTLRRAQRTRGLASCVLRGDFISAVGRVSRCLTVRTEDHLNRSQGGMCILRECQWAQGTIFSLWADEVSREIQPVLHHPRM